MASHPLVLSPALPTELLWYIIHSCAYPTTLIVGSSRSEFLASLVQDVAIARHIRIVFAPTVSHLRAFLSVFSVKDSKVPSPPSAVPVVPKPNTADTMKHPLLLIYGFLHIHRETSEWSVQGLSNTAAVFVEAARRVAFQAVVVEPIIAHEGEEERDPMTLLLTEMVPILSGSARRAGPGLAGSGWTGKTVDVRRVLGRWFRFKSCDWGPRDGDENNAHTPEKHNSFIENDDMT
ncbi:hypothetical protein B0T17DRAFT_519588 [Bombardia bombarda]|uniref:Uncharacterized protein n=1 Tax=Bombardia bombarda TaxID=252184 RepID=A0AA40CFS4_9PEZI|nr:hypothetical protein B0T17DRAFT_519588 [Bombardia bombarda]